ncbi:protein FAR1-RELATED SEQUENCE 5-like [Phoenix dactylifera]|uniref:Protein FAR1-RELATED SEQUENCE 5-like n=1 Tax=Phoenix dactylifera TaxID=42345 RepID=A0A8B8ZTZ4_PHODC|nr:protein FAR1-RELATED SEQUENCE 5-like [Phoenix dactylifera]
MGDLTAADLNGKEVFGHPKTNPPLFRKLTFEDGDSLVRVNSLKPISVDSNDEIHANVAEEVIPKLGIEFETEQEAYDFYNNYARAVGFSIRRSKGQYEKGNQDDLRKWLDRVFYCSCQGLRGNDKRDDDVKRHGPETRCGCLAEMKISRRASEKYSVIKFVSNHTHVLASPRKRIFLRSHRTINPAQAVEAELADTSGIAPKASIGLLARRVGGLDNLGFIPEDYNNYLRTRRTQEMKIGDTGGLLEYLQRMQSEDLNFSYVIQADVDDLITNIFWADGRMRLDYEYFGDVVCFDTTYKKNKEGRPFALFVGVNHHKQSIIFGAALLYDETSETFMWLFDSFQKTMFGKKPQTILTDQDPAMAKALASQWPETKHRLCIWHMYQNAGKKLNDVFGRYSSFAKDFSSCVYDHDDEDDFLHAWDKMLDKYDLRDNSWLQRQFEIKEKWALVYGRKIFCAICLLLREARRLVDDRRFEELQSPQDGAFSSRNQLLPQHTMQNYYGANLNTRGFTETLNLIQAQLPKIREQRNDEDAG